MTVTGTVSATAFSGDGSALTGISAGSTSEVRANTLVVTGVSTFSDTVTITKAASPLKVNTLTTNAAIEIQRSGSTKAYLTPENGEFRIQTYSSEDIALQTNAGGGTAGDITFKSVDTEIFKVKGTGNVGIHSTVPTSRLDVVGDAKVSGVVTATSFVGDGSALTGISGSGGVTVQDEGSALSTTGTTLNFVGSGVVASGSGATKTITIAGGGASTGEAFVNLRDSSNPPALSNSGRNIIIGVQAAHKFGNGSASGGNENVFLGYVAGYTQTNGDGNVYIGAEAGYSNATSAGNVYVGAGAGRFATGANNVCLGRFAGNAGGFSGSNNLVIGYNSDPSSTSVSNKITLGDANITKFRVPGINVVLKDNGGTPTQGHVLTVDANGEAGFAAASGGGSSNVGITTNLSGSFTASAGSPSTINTFGYGSGDIVVEYTVFIKNGSDFQSQKLLAMRDGTTIHSTQFAVMYSSSLLVQLDATISSGNILLRATPETGVSGSTTYKIKREVM